jgi:integrase
MRSRVRKNKVKRGARRGAPIAVNWTVPPRRVGNATRRPREYLTVKEVELLMETARKRGRYGHRDATMILVAFRHGLRPAEACALRWDMVDFAQGLLHVRRVKNGTPSVQPLAARGFRVACSAETEARGNREPVRVHDGTCRADYDGGIPEDDRADRGERGVSVSGASAHAASRLRLQARKRWARYAGGAALSRTQQHPAHGAVY